jgi:uncharacterized protein (TIGR02118 family)
MYKLISFSKRKSGMSQEEFVKYWYEVHGKMIQDKLPPKIKAKIKKYAQYPVVQIPGHQQPFDGVVEFTFEDYESLQSWNKFYASDEAKVFRDDQANFSNPDTLAWVITEEKVILSR